MAPIDAAAQKLPKPTSDLTPLFLNPGEPKAMPDPTMAETPFAALTLIGAPALLTNASSVLLMSTSNRLGRTVNRARALAEAIAEDEEKAAAGNLFWQLAIAERRVLISIRAMTANYLALGCFAAGTLAALVGAFGSDLAAPWALTISVAVTIATGGIGFLSLITAAGMLVLESQLAYRLLRDEAERVREAWANRQ